VGENLFRSATVRKAREYLGGGKRKLWDNRESRFCGSQFLAEGNRVGPDSLSAITISNPGGGPMFDGGNRHNLCSTFSRGSLIDRRCNDCVRRVLGATSQQERKSDAEGKSGGC